MQSLVPPTLPTDKQPFTRMLLPLVMVIAVAGMVGAMILTGAGRSPMTFMFPLMMLGTMAMMFTPGTNIDEQRRSFHRSLDALEDSLRTAHEAQVAAMTWQHPDPRSLWTFLDAGEDRPCEPGVVRIGMAEQEPAEKLDIPLTTAVEDLEPVCALSLRDLAHRYATITAPVALDLREFRCVVIDGPRAEDVARALQAQLVMQSPSDVMISGPNDEWLPHTGPLHIRFGTGDLPLGSGCVITDPTDAWIDAAKTHGIYLWCDDDLRLWAWTTQGWADFADADSLSAAELTHLCRARATVGGRRSILELPGGELRAPIGFAGTGQSGSPVFLDITEAALGGDGPHGICVGATGAGKSEFLKAVVISFAHHHRPEELNFILVDFKGGATFLDMDRLPHVSALITNLEGEAALVDRMRDALMGELHRRQERLRAAGMTTAAEFNRAHPGEMPALFIIVDEFSELLSARPEFAEVFTAIGRLGRSLRMHLLLATQRLDEARMRGLEAHMSYRIVLRTFTASESRMLIGSAAAYELPHTPGAAIFATTTHTRFQSAYVSGPELPRDQRLVRPLGAVAQVDSTTTADRVIDRLAGPNTTPVWLEPLPAELPASAIMAPGANQGACPGTRTRPEISDAVPLSARVAMEDLPFEGLQRPFDMDLRSKHWAIVGQPQSGKTMALRSLVVGLTLSSPGVAIYVFDPGGSLQPLARIPQVAAVVGPEHLGRLLDAVDLHEGPRVLLIDGIDHLGDELPRLTEMTATGLERGLHLVITSHRWTFRPGLRDMIAGTIELALNPHESHHRALQAVLPSIPGRGITPAGTHMHVAMTTTQDIEHARRVSAQRGEVELSMRVLPTMLTRAELDLYAPSAAPQAAGTAVPTLAGVGTGAMPASARVVLGVGGPRLEPIGWDMGDFPHLLVIGEAGAGATTTLLSAVAGVRELHAAGGPAVRVLLTDTRRGLLGDADYRVPEEFRAELAEIVEMLRGRIPGPDVTPEQLRARSWWEGPEVVIVVDDADSDPGLDVLLPLLDFAADIGLHLVLARRSSTYARASFSPLMQGIRDHSAVVLLSAPRDDGPIHGQRLGPRDPGRACLVTRTAVEMQVAVPEPVAGWSR